MSLLEAVIFFSLWAFGLGQLKLEQSEISVYRSRDKSAHISCKVSSSTFSKDYIHWYRQKPDQVPLEFEKLGEAKLARFLILVESLWKYGRKLFGDGTKLVITERSLDSSDIAPKPTIFLPSVEEINLHKAGTYLCLLEKFFPDVIKVYWKEKDGNAILASQQGNTVKTNDTYMKFSWLTVTAKSMDKEHKCIVKHENNKRGVDQEILFPSINKGNVTEAVRMQDHEPRNGKNKSLESEKEVAGINSTIDDCLKDKRDLLQLQLTNTSAYYTYLLLLFKSLVYFASISFCLFRRTVVYGHGKSS